MSIKSPVLAEDLKKEIEEEVLQFQRWFRATIEQTDLHPVEASILRTYLQWRALFKNQEQSK